jgi:hypothetical protein
LKTSAKASNIFRSSSTIPFSFRSLRQYGREVEKRISRNAPEDKKKRKHWEMNVSKRKPSGA